MFQKPGVADLRHAADALGMSPSMLYLNAMQDIVAPLCAAYAAIDAWPDDKPAVIDMLANWARDIAPAIGWNGNGRLLTGSVGAREATVVHEWTVKDLADLERAWAALAKVEP